MSLTSLLVMFFLKSFFTVFHHVFYDGDAGNKYKNLGKGPNHFSDYLMGNDKSFHFSVVQEFKTRCMSHV